nr:MAG TPA: hypothetical protein [Caudoviricetes sp.]
MEYLPWLIERGCLSEYRTLASVWDEIEFIWYIPEDEDRAIQALRLRDEYAYEFDYRSPRQGPVTFLEVFVSITDTLSAMVYQDREKFTRSILMNLGVSNLLDSECFSTELYSRGLDSAETVMYRNYHQNGSGGLFKVPGAKMLEIPLFDQMVIWANRYDPYH